MTFSGLFAIGLSGVNAHAASLEAVAQNIANTQTAGYKRARIDFSTLVTSYAPDGGIEGGGVEAKAHTLLREQGAIIRTASSTDIAISGDGFFVVSDNADPGGAVSFTRSGGFSARPDGLLVNDAGFFLRATAFNNQNDANPGALSALETVNINRVTSLAAPTSRLTIEGNLSANAPVGETTAQHFQLFDSDGAERTLTLTLTAAGDSVFNASLVFADGAEETLGAGTLIFNPNGRLDAAASTMPLSFSANASQTIDLDLGGLSSRAGETQFTRASADGAAAGALTGVEITRDGRIVAQFSNGLTQGIYRVALATFSNPEGLEEGVGSTFQLTTASGVASLDVPQTGRAGALEGNALEVSTVDIGQEFSTLIETQRAYAANARVISMADELWRTITEIAQ